MRRALLPLLLAGCAIQRVPSPEGPREAAPARAAITEERTGDVVRMHIPYDGPTGGWYGTPGVVAGDGFNPLDILKFIKDPAKLFDFSVPKPGRWGDYEIDELMRILDSRRALPRMEFQKDK